MAKRKKNNGTSNGLQNIIKNYTFEQHEHHKKSGWTRITNIVI
jgi:hypothetical protein